MSNNNKDAIQKIPKFGDVYEALHDITLDYFTSYRIPYTGGGQGLLLQGEKVEILNRINEELPYIYYCDPLNYREVELRIVHASEREIPEYNGYSLIIGTEILNSHFRQIIE